MGNASGWSGAYVNVGRSLRVNGRCDVHQALYGSRRSSNALCTTAPGDKYWCTRARALGYDSIQILRGVAYYPGSMKRKPWSELVLCSGECSTRTFSESACVPSARAISADGQVQPCNCPEGATLISCDGQNRTSGTMKDWLPLHVPGQSLRGIAPWTCRQGSSILAANTIAAEMAAWNMTAHTWPVEALPEAPAVESDTEGAAVLPFAVALFAPLYQRL